MTEMHDAIRKWLFEGPEVAIKAIRALAQADPTLLDKHDESGSPPLFLACSMMNPGPVKLLIELGADVNARNSTGWPVFMFAASSVGREVLELMIEKGADPRASLRGETALHRAMLNEQTAVENAKMLLELGVDINSRDAMGWNALDKAALDNLVEATVFLLSKGAEANHIDGRGMTALQVAKKRGYDEIVAVLEQANGPT